MTTLTTPILGVNLAETPTTQDINLGAKVTTGDGKEYLYVQANGAITGAGYVVLIDETYQATMIDTTNSATARGDIVGVPGAAFADNDYGWVQIKGACVVRVAASAAANVRLNTTATAGQLDDDGSVGSEEVTGLVLTTANGGAAATAAAMLNYPAVGVTL